MRTLLALVESTDQLYFFARLQPAAVKAGFRFRFITARWSDAFRARQRGLDVHLVNRSADSSVTNDLDGVGELLSGSLSADGARLYYAAFASAMEDIIRETPYGVVMMWGGGDTAASRALRNSADRHGWQHLYFDRGNIAGTLIVDPDGMNFGSYLHSHPSLLDRDSDTSIIAQLRSAVRSRTSPAAVQANRQRNWLAIFDLIHSTITGIPHRGSVVPRWHPSRASFSFDFGPVGDQRIILVPMDHSFELQKVQGGIGFVREQAAAAQRTALELSLPVVVTLHPLEQSEELFRLLRELRSEFHFVIRKESSSSLLGHADAVVAANTSVVLESLIMGIPVVHIGRSIFRDFNERRLSAYLSQYLLSIDPRSTSPVTDAEFRSIVERADWK